MGYSGLRTYGARLKNDNTNATKLKLLTEPQKYHRLFLMSSKRYIAIAMLIVYEIRKQIRNRN